MKNKFFLGVLLTLAVSVFIFADESGDKKKFPGEFSLSYTDVKGYGVIDNRPGMADYTNPGGSIYSKSTVEGSIKFPVNFYSISPFVKDELLITVVPNDLKSSLLRNRFSFGLLNYFTIDKIVDIGVHFDGRVGSKTNLDVSADPYDVELRLAPVLELSGSYDFGLSWGVSESFRFYTTPANLDDLSSNKLQLSGIYYLGFEFFHFFAPEDFTCQFYTELDADFNIFYKQISSDSYGVDWLEYYAGLNFSFYGISPYAGFLLTGYGTFKDWDNSGVVYAGIKTGISYSKDWFSIGVQYIGNKNIKSGDAYKWENSVEVSASFSL